MYILKNFYDSVITTQGIIIITVLLLLILVIALLIGWNINRSKPFSLEKMLHWLNEKYDRGEIQKKEFLDVKDEVENSFNQINYYLKIYNKRN